MGQTINQVRHLYVVDSGATIETVAKGDLLYFKYNNGTGNPVVSDKINLANVESVKHTTAEKMEKQLNKYTYTINEAAKGVEYIVRVTLKNYIGLGDNNMAFKYGMAIGTGDTGKLAKELAESLLANSKDVTPLFDVEYNESTISISEEGQDWVRGKMAKEAIPFEIEFLPVLVEGVETNDWVSGPVVTNAGTIENGYDIADLEYFCMGARGDYYRGMGYPNTIETKYLADETTSYDTIDIHYYYTGANESVQKSEKDITIAFKDKGALNTVKSALTAAGLTVK